MPQVVILPVPSPGSPLTAREAIGSSAPPPPFFASSARAREGLRPVRRMYTPCKQAFWSRPPVHLGRKKRLRASRAAEDSVRFHELDSTARSRAMSARRWSWALNSLLRFLLVDADDGVLCRGCSPSSLPARTRRIASGTSEMRSLRARHALFLRQRRGRKRLVRLCPTLPLPSRPSLTLTYSSTMAPNRVIRVAIVGGGIS